MEQNNFSYAKRKVIVIPVLLFLLIIGLINFVNAGYVWGTTYTYDPLTDNSINTSLWTNTSCTGTGTNTMCVTESGGVIETKAVTQDANMRDAQLVSIDMPNYDALDNVSIPVYLSIAFNFGGSASYGVSFTAFNSIINSATKPAGPYSDLSTYTFIRSGSQFLIYNDGVYFTTITPATNTISIRAYAGYLNGGGTQTVISQIYPITFVVSNRSMNIVHNFPENNYYHYSESPPTNITFNVSTSTILNNLKNITFYVDGSPRYSEDITGTSNISTYSNNFSVGTHTWNTYVCDDMSNCKFSDLYTFYESAFITLNTTYEPSVYETDSQTFNVTVLYNTATYPNAYAYLTYNGILYPVSAVKTISGPNVIFSSTIDVPASTGVKPFYFTVYFDPTNPSNAQTTTINNQTINSISYVWCDTGNKFLTFNYINEVNNIPVNLSVTSSTWNYWLGSGSVIKSYSYLNTALVNTTDSFCFTPVDKTVYTSFNYQYGVQGLYPPRTFQTSILTPPYFTLTNTTTNQNLYTISLADSSSFTFQVIDQASASVITGATITLSRSILGVTTQVFSGLTDGAGIVNVFLSSTTPYTVTASKAGCGSFTTTITPVTSYNIQLNCAGNLTQYSSQIDGVTYVRTPASGVTTNYGNIDYEYRVVSVLSPMTSAKFTLVDQQGNIVASNETYTNSSLSFCNSSSCTLTLRYNSVCGDNIKGRYYINLGNVSNGSYILLEADALWRFLCINESNSQNSFVKAFDHFNQFFYQWSAGGQSGVSCFQYKNSAECNAVDYCKWVNYVGYAGTYSPGGVQIGTSNYTGTSSVCILKDDYNKAEFSRIILIFFGLVIVLFVMGKTTGYEMTNPGSFLMFMTGLIIILSFGGMFRFVGATPWPFFDQWIYAFICMGFSVGYNIAIVRRYSA